MKITIKKDWKFLIILFIAISLILLVANYTVSIKNKLYTKGRLQETTGVIQDVSQGMEVIQNFVAVDNNLERVILNFESYKDDANCGGKVLLGIKDYNGKILEEKQITRNYIRENPQYMLNFEKQTNSKDKEYSIYIKFEDLSGAEKFYSLKTTNLNEAVNDTLYIDGEAKNNISLAFQDLYKSNIRCIIYIGILFILVVGVIVISIIIYTKKNIKVENLFLMIVPFLCIFFLLSMPTFKNHDEYYHWLKAYEVSEWHLKTPNNDGIQGSMMPGAVAGVMPIDWATMDYSQVKEKLHIRLDEEDKVLLNPETAALYSFVQYIPQAIGITISRFFTNNVYLITYAGRFFNMLVSVLLLYLAIKIMPFGKKLLLIPAMIPIAIEGFSSLSPDAMTISMSFLYIAYILHLTFVNEEKIKLKEKILLLIMSVIIALCKIVYIPLVGLILIIPKEKFKNNKNKIFNFCVIAGTALILNLIWLKIASGYLADFREGDSKIKVLLALQNPIQYVQNVLYTINLNGSSYLMSLFGADLGWGELVKLYAIVPYFILAIYLFVAITDEELKNKFKTYQLVWIALITITTILLVFTSLYVQWTPIGKDSISGVQGRYFLPILPLVMLLLGSVLKVKTTYKVENINKFVAISILVLQIYTVSQIIMVHL